MRRPQWIPTPRQPLSGPKIGPPLADYPPRRYQQAHAVVKLVDDHRRPAELIRRLYDIQMGVSAASYTRMIDIMRLMAYGVAGRLPRPLGKPLSVLDRDRHNATSILGLIGSPHPDALLEPETHATYFETVLPDSPDTIMGPLVAVNGHPRVWAAQFMAAAARLDHATIRDDLLIPYLLPRPEDLTILRFLTLGMAEFACTWSALWQGERAITSPALAIILDGLDLRCPAHHKRLFHEDIPHKDTGSESDPADQLEVKTA